MILFWCLLSIWVRGVCEMDVNVVVVDYSSFDACSDRRARQAHVYVSFLFTRGASTFDMYAHQYAAVRTSGAVDWR